MDWKRITAAMLLVCTLAIPARAEEAPKGEANITPQTTMRELRANPSIIGSGIYTYSQEQENECRREKWADTTLEEFVNSYTADECAKGLNHLIENYNAGVQITHKIYTVEEIAAVPSRNKAELYYFPGNTKGGKYVLILGGNAVNTSAELREGVTTAEEMNELGYTAFVLRYRIGRDAENDAPLEDISHAVAYITAHAEELGVSPEDYAIVGYSSGGQIAGFFGSDELGWKKYGLPKPGALLLGYPVNSFSYNRCGLCASTPLPTAPATLSVIWTSTSPPISRPPITGRAKTTRSWPSSGCLLRVSASKRHWPSTVCLTRAFTLKMRLIKSARA